METTSHDTANQYLSFGWSLINQYVVPATADSPATVKFVLASIRRLEDTRQVVVLTEGRPSTTTWRWAGTDRQIQDRPGHPPTSRAD